MKSTGAFEEEIILRKVIFALTSCIGAEDLE
jgi:hypothetical protein